MSPLQPGDLVVALPVDACSIGHPPWHRDFSHPDMNRKTYLVTAVGFSRFGKRPIVGVAGRKGRYCAGCFARTEPTALIGIARKSRILEQA